MNDIKQEITRLIDDLLAGRNLANDDIVRLVLLGAAVLATCHLVTMLVTRWGDRNVAAKSFFFSVLLHFCCWMGLASAPPLLPRAQAALDPVEREIPVRELLVESEQTVETRESGNTPIWEELAPPEMELARLAHTAHDLTPPEAIERDAEQFTPRDFNFDDIEDNPEAAMQASIPVDQGVEGPRQPASAVVDVDIETEQIREDVRANSPSMARFNPARVGDLDDIDLTRDAVQGATDRIDPNLSETELSPFPDAMPAPDALANPGELADSSRRRSGPVPALSAEQTAGTPTDNTERGGTGTSAPRRLARANARRATDRTGRSLDMNLERTPQTPTPMGRDYNDVRISPAIDPLSGSVEVRIGKPEFDATASRRRNSMPATYQLRNLEKRQAVARQFGGTTESEQAVERSLRWLADHQHPAGYWDASSYGSGQVKLDENRVDRKNAGIDADTGVTALCVLAFLGAGYTHEEGKYTSVVDRALQWLVSQQAESGSLAGQATHFAKMYCHAMATYALAEAYGMQSDPTTDTRLRRPLLSAVEYIVNEQNPNDGGWRYIKGQDGDMSMFGWQLMALKSAEIAGMKIPSEVRTRMFTFLQERGLGRYGGLAAYRAGDKETPTMTAESMFCRQMLGYPNNSRAVQEAAAYLLQNRPRLAELNLYYWYYGTLAMYQRGGEDWESWNQTVRELLVADQIRDGQFDGTWDPKGPWGPYGGRLYSTAVSTLTLEVYYRFLPLYRMNDIP